MQTAQNRKRHRTEAAEAAGHGSVAGLQQGTGATAEWAIVVHANECGKRGHMAQQRHNRDVAAESGADAATRGRHDTMARAIREHGLQLSVGDAISACMSDMPGYAIHACFPIHKACLLAYTCAAALDLCVW